MTTLPFLLLALSPFVMSDSDYVPPPWGGGVGWGHIVFSADPVGVGVASCPHSIS